MKKTIIVLVSVLCLSVYLFAFVSKDGAGTTSGQFLKLGAGARAPAMGEAFAGISDDATAIYWNPAGLNNIVQKEISLMYAMWFEEINHNNIFYVHPTEIGNFGAGIQYISYGTLEGLDENGNPADDFSPTDLSITISYAREIAKINLGASAKYISSKIKETATAFAIDIGAMKKFKDDKLSLGFVLQNLGTGLKYIKEEDPLPMRIKIGAGYKIKENITTGFDITLPSDNEIIIGLGGEYNYRIKENTIVSARLGYNTTAKDVEGGLKGLTAGLGGNYKTYKIDYAFVPYGDLGITHRISFGIKF